MLNPCSSFMKRLRCRLNQTTMFALFVSSMSCVKQTNSENRKTISVFVQTDLSTTTLNYYLLLSMILYNLYIQTKPIRFGNEPFNRKSIHSGTFYHFCLTFTAAAPFNFPNSKKKARSARKYETNKKVIIGETLSKFAGNIKKSNNYIGFFFTREKRKKKGKNQ